MNKKKHALILIQTQLAREVQEHWGVEHKDDWIGYHLNCTYCMESRAEMRSLNDKIAGLS